MRRHYDLEDEPDTTMLGERPSIVTNADLGGQLLITSGGVGYILIHSRAARESEFRSQGNSSVLGR